MLTRRWPRTHARLAPTRSQWFGCLSQSDVERHTLAKYLMELTLLDYDMVHYRPSEVAAAALCLSQLLLDGLPWVSERSVHSDPCWMVTFS